MEQNEQKTPASTRAIVALVMGILSITCTGFLTGIPAIILGLMEIRAIKAGLAPHTGDQMAKVGLALGIVGTILMALAILVTIAFIVFGISVGTSGVIQDLMKSTSI